MKKFLAILLAVAMLLTLVACGKKDDKPAEEPDDDSAVGSAETPADAPEDDPQVPAEEAKTIVMWYGSNYYPGEETYATFSLPEGAYFEEGDYEEYLEDGSVYTVTVYDDVREYMATSADYHSSVLYKGELGTYSLMQQLYFDGEVIVEKTEEEYESYSQTVTDLGFQWEGLDVILVETYSTLKGYSEQLDQFVCVEYEYPYWEAKEGGGTEDKVTACLLGFHMESMNWDDLTVDQCAWIAGQLFGVDSGRTWSLETEEEVPVNIGAFELYGAWVERDSVWEDTYVFNPDGTGMLISGPEYPYTYSVSGDTLTLTYGEDDIETYTISIDGTVLTMIDHRYSSEALLDKDETFVAGTSDAPTEAPKDAVDAATLAAELIGTWLDEAAGYNEGFTFKADGRGVYTWLDEVYEFSYELDEDYIDINFDDGDYLGYFVEIQGNELILSSDWTLIRQ